MKKFLKKLFKVVFYFSALFLILISIVLIITQTERFRIFIHDKVESELRKSIGGDIYLGKFYGNLFTGLGIDGFRIDVDGKTFIKALSIELKYNPIGLIRGSYSFDEFIIYKPEVNLIRDRNGNWNYQKIIKPRKGDASGRISVSFYKFVIDDGKFSLVDSLNLKTSALAESLNCINYHNFTIHDINLNLSGSYSSEKIDLRSFKLSFIVDEGKFNADLSGKIFMDKEELQAKDVEILTGRSRAKFNFFASTKDNLFKLDRNTIENVYMSVYLVADSFSFGDLTKFIPSVHFLNGSPSVEIEAEGTLKDLKIKRINSKIYDSEISITGELKNVIKFSDFLIDAQIQNSKINTSDIEKFVTLVNLPEFKVKQFYLDGRYIGHPLDFTSSVNFNWDKTIVNLDAKLKIKDDFAYDLNFRVSDLNPEDILNTESMRGILNFSGNLSGKGVGFDNAEARARVEISESFVNKVLLPKSNFLFDLRGGELNGTFVSISEGFKGIIDLNLKKDEANQFLLSLSGSLTDLDLSQIRTDKPHFLRSHISGDFILKFTSGNFKKMDLFAQLNPSSFGNYKISKLRLNARYTEDAQKKSLNLQSNMFDLNLEGKFNFDDLFKSVGLAIKTIQGKVNEKLNFVKFEGVSFGDLKNQVEVDYKIKFKNLTPISVFSIGQIFQAIGNLDGVFLSDSGGFYFYSNANLKDIAYLNFKDGKIDTFKFGYFNGEVEFDYKSEKLKFEVKGLCGNFDSRVMQFDRANVNFAFEEPNLYAEFSGKASDWDVEIVSLFQFGSEANRYILKNFVGEIYGSRIYIEDEIEFFQTKSGLVINPASFLLNGQKFYIAGFIDKQTQQLRLWGENLKLDSALKTQTFSGDVDFSIFVYGTHDKPSSEVEILIKDFMYKEIKLGEFQCFGKVEGDVINLNSSLLTEVGDVKYNAMDMNISIPMWFRRDVSVKYPKPYVIGKMKLFRFPVAVFEPFISDVSDLRGDITANVDFQGTFDNPNFKGNFSLQNCIFRFKPNNKYYLVYGSGKIDSNVVYVEDLSLWNNPDDYRDGEVQIKGAVYFDRYSISRGNFSINGKLLIVDKEGFGDTGFYGRVIAETGGNGLSLKIDTTGLYLNGEILLSDVDLNYLPKRATSISKGTGFEYVYLNPFDTLKTEETQVEQLVYLDIPVKTGGESLEVKRKHGIFSSLNYDLMISTSKNAKLNLVLNTQTGEEFFAEFTGRLNLRNYSGSTLAYGEIDILDRSYYNFFKRFNASGKLKFTGDLNSPELDIIASYTGTHTVLTDTISAGKVETVQIKLLISGTLSKPIVKVQMFIDGEDYQKVYPHGEVESDAISFLVTGRFKDELTSGEVAMFTENLWSSAGASLLSTAVSGVITDILRDVLGGFITSTEFGYYSGFKGLRITGNIGGAVIQFGGDIFTDISKSVVVIQYPIFKKIFGGNLTIEYQRKPIQFYQEKEIVNKLGLYYRIRL